MTANKHSDKRSPVPNTTGLAKVAVQCSASTFVVKIATFAKPKTAVVHRMKSVESTYEIIAWKHLNHSVDEKWSNWAIDMMMIGYDTEHLVELAGIEKPFNQFELKELTDKVFAELCLDYSNQDKVVIDYVTYLAKEILNDNRDLLKTLREIKDLCIALDYDSKIYDFFSLYFAKEDLNYDTVQWYWNGADRTNIDQICLEYLKEWIDKHELG